MQIEGVVITVIFISFIAYRIFKARRMIKDMYIMGFNMMCLRFGVSPYIPKEKKSLKK